MPSDAKKLQQKDNCDILPWIHFVITNIEGNQWAKVKSIGTEVKFLNFSHI